MNPESLQDPEMVQRVIETRFPDNPTLNRIRAGYLGKWIDGETFLNLVKTVMDWEKWETFPEPDRE